MPFPLRRLALPTLLAMALLPTAVARGDAAYDRVAASYAEGGGQLDACFFTQAELEAGLRGIPPQVADVVPEIRKAIRDGIRLHEQGGCAGRTPGVPAGPDSSVSSGALPPVTTTPTAPTTTAAPNPGAETTAADPTREDERTALLIALVALGALALLALLAWALGRARGWEPAWTARSRHAWGEAGFRTSTTWSEFTDWLRLGR